MLNDSKEATARLDSIVESDVVRGFRVREVPNNLQEILRINDFAVPVKVKFLAMNAARRRDINEAVQKRYHKDLRDPEILSNAQLRELVEKRGEWSAKDDERMTSLNERVQGEMLSLWRDGYSDDGAAWSKDLAAHMETIDAALEREKLTKTERAKFKDLYARWVAWTPEQQAVYTEQYAKEQALEEYRPDRDLNNLLSMSPSVEVADLLNAVDELRDKQRRLTKLALESADLQQLRMRHARIFSGSAESRQSTAEELAQVYFACDQVDADEKSGGRLTTTFEEFYNWPHEVVKWFLYEAYFFHNDIPQVAAEEYLQTYGFLRADPASEPVRGESKPSDALLDPQLSSDGSKVAAETPSSSLELAMASS